MLAYERGERMNTVLRLATPSAGAFVAALLLGLVAALAVGFAFEVEVTGRAPGVLRSPGGVQIMAAAIAGTVRQVHARSGDTVEAGQSILVLDAAPLQAERVSAVRDLELARTRLRELEQHRELHERGLQLLRDRAALQERRSRSEAATLETLSERLATYAALGQRGYVSRASAEDIEEQRRAAERSRLMLEQEGVSTRLEEVTLERERSDQLRSARADLSAAQSRCDALDTLLAQTDLRAPSAGRVEGLEAHAGDEVQPHQALATLVPLAAPSEVVVFADDRDRAFLRVGSSVSLEVDQLPMAEFGVLTGAIRSIGAHFAAPREQQTALGDDAAPRVPCYRVEIALAPTAQNQVLLERLSAGALITARFSLRRRRLITLAFEPLHALLDRKD